MTDLHSKMTERVWGTFTRADLARRDAVVLELHAMGLDRKDIAERVDLTPQRISQIVREAR